MFVPVTQIPEGLINRAVLPTPSVWPWLPADPTYVVTAWVATTIFRTVELLVSVTNRLVPSPQIPLGALKRAAVPVPSVDPTPPDTDPANVVTAPVAMT